MYRKLVIGEADVRVFGRVRPEQRTTANETVDTRVDVIRPDRMIICSDWPTTLRYHFWV